MKNFYNYICLFLLSSSFSNAQLPVHIGDKINEKVTVTAVDENENYYWVGTNKGVYKVNKAGKDYVYYSSGNSELQSNLITSVCCRKNGDVWIGTAKGILQYDNYAFNAIDTDNSKLPENYITSMKEDVNGDLWIGTLTSGLVKVHGRRFFLYNQDNSNLAGNSIQSIKNDQQNKLVVSLTQNDAVLLSSIVKK